MNIRVALAVVACVAMARAQELSLDEEDEAPKVEARGVQGKGDAQIESLKRALKKARNAKQKADVQVKLLHVLSGDERFEFARTLRDAKGTPTRAYKEALAVICGESWVNYGIWGGDWYRKYVLNWPDGKIADYEKQYAESIPKLVAANPNNVDIRWQYASSLCYRAQRGDAGVTYDQAIEQYEKAIEQLEDDTGTCRNCPGGKPYQLAGLNWELANCHFGKGEKDRALEILEKFLARGFKFQPLGRAERGYVNNMRAAVCFMRGRELNSMRLPIYTGAKPFPQPQKAEYTEEFADGSAVCVKLHGVAENDYRLKLLRVKLTEWMGAKIEPDAPFAIDVALDPKAPVDKPEGYTLEITGKGASIRARDRQGVLWGIVSLIQCADRERKAFRVCKVDDWPSFGKRGYLGSWWPGTVEYTLFQKMNSVDHQRHPCFENNFRPLAWWIEAEMGRQFHDLGLELFYGMCWTTHAPQIPIAHPRTLPYRVSVYRKYAAAHIGVYYPLDDIRFPVEQVDLDKFGSAAAIDGKHQSAIYREVAKEFPDWRFIVCAPFYWGPDGRASFYPEQRDPYLAQWRKDLDPGIEVYWTGPRVKSGRYQQYHSDWALNAYGRKSYIFQNVHYSHNLLHYTVDSTDWKAMFHPGFFENTIRGFHLNSHTPNDCSRIASLADFLWNMDAFDRVNAQKRGCNQLMGERMYDILSKGSGAHWFFTDNFKYGAVTGDITEFKLEDIQAKVDLLRDCWTNALAYAKSQRVPIYGDYGRGVGYAEKVLAVAKNPPKMEARYAGLIKSQRMRAEFVAKFDAERGDAFVSPGEMTGGKGKLWVESEEDPKSRRYYFRVASGNGGAVAFAYTCDPFPPEGDFFLHLGGMSFGGSGKVRVKVNGKVAYEGALRFPGGGQLGAAKMRLPAKLFDRSNTVEIESREDGGGFGVAWGVMKPE